MLEVIQKMLIDDIRNHTRNLARFLDQSIPNIDARLDIFANNRTFGHLDFLASIYPITKQLLGEDFFDAITKDFISTSEQSGGNRHEYGSDFGQFLNQNPKLDSFAYIGGIAAIEWAHFTANLAEDAVAISLGEISAKLEAGDIFGLALHPSTTIINCQFNALEIWQAHQASVFEGIELRECQSNLLCWRDEDDEVLFSRISEDFSNLLSHPQLKIDFAAAISEAISATQNPTETAQFQTEFAELTNAGLFIISTET